MWSELLIIGYLVIGLASAIVAVKVMMKEDNVVSKDDEVLYVGFPVMLFWPALWLALAIAIVVNKVRQRKAA
jgi:hypothetical protein